MASVTIKTDVTPDPNAKPASNIVGDGNQVVVDPNKPASDKGDESRPAWLPEKFATPEDMAKAYGELEKKQGQQSQSSLDAKQTEKQIVDAGLDARALAKEVAEKGDLSAESKKALADKGIPADTFVAGLRAQQTQATSELSAIAGGEKEFKVVQEWAAANLTEAEITAYNAALDAGSLDGAKLMMHSIVAKYKASVGSEPKLVAGDSQSGAGSVAPFASTQQMVDAMKDQRYTNDPAYRAEVQRRIEVSQTFESSTWNAGGTPGSRVALR